jgi:hypothetical protein
MTPGESSQAYIVDMDKMANFMTREIDLFWSKFESDDGNKLCSIPKVPQHILEVDKNAYEPIILSIGPYHHGAPNLVAMEKEKWKCLDFILKLNCEVSLQDYIRAVYKVEKKARGFYSEDIEMNKMEFVKMLLLDSCFILVKVDGTVLTATPLEEVHTDITTTGSSGQEAESYCSMQRHAMENSVHEIELTRVETNNTGNYDQNARYPCDYNSYGDWYANFVWHDLFLLENQMPFFIVETIYNIALSKRREKPLLRDKIFECVEDILRQFPKGIEESDRPKSFQHFLHLCHMHMQPTHVFLGTKQIHSKVRFYHRLIQSGQRFFNPGPKQEGNDEQLQLVTHQKDCFQDNQLPKRWHQAVHYHETGIQLKKRKYNIHDRHSLLDIKFDNGVLEVPCFLIDENTESLFKNLIAFEQMDSQYENYITAYVAFMSELVSTSEDATLLT